MLMVAGCGGSEIETLSPAIKAGAGGPGGKMGRPASRADTPDPASGLTRAERAEFHHLPEGSEIFPLALMAALDDATTGRPFLENMERFGLFDDYERVGPSPALLPVGLTAAPSRDLRFANIMMVGVNCGACHAGALEVKGKRVLIEGAPGTFDLTDFYKALGESTQKALADPSTTWALMGRLYQMYRYVPPPPGGPSGGGGGGGGGGTNTPKGQFKGFTKKGGQGKAQGKGGAGAAGKGTATGTAKAKASTKTAPAPLSPPRLVLMFGASAQEKALLAAPPNTETGMGPRGGVGGLPLMYPSLDALKATGVVERSLAEAVERLHREEMARPALDGTPLLDLPATAEAGAKTGEEGAAGTDADSQVLAEYLAALADDGPGRDATLARFGEELTTASARLRERLLGPLPAPETLWKPRAGSRGEGLPQPEAPSVAYPGGPPPEFPGAAATADAATLGALLRDFVETTRLLRARAAFLAGLSRGGRASSEATEPGPGRVDIFGAARALIFPDDPAPETAPVDYPHLWGLGRVAWYHWDASTTSALERNVGQALGVGALIDRQTAASTLLINNLERLEQISTKLKPPAWPEAAFGAIDRARFARGAAVFQRRCAECHTLPAEGQKAADRLADLDTIGTDPNRARNFARPVKEVPFNEAISKVLKAVVARGGGTTAEEDLWRVTQAYPGRPLIAIWATAPYLHNGSVPTLHHLLLPEDQRPKTFARGHREYDPKLLGYTLEGTPARRWMFDTSQPGNSNKGHSGPRFGTDLPDADREAVLEYLKANERTDLGG